MIIIQIYLHKLTILPFYYIKKKKIHKPLKNYLIHKDEKQ